MMKNVIPIERDPHRAVQALLPWYVRGRLEPEELRELQTHLRGCSQCRAELEAEQLLLDLPAPSSAGGDVEAGLTRLRARLEGRAADRSAQRMPADGPAWPRGRGWSGRAGWILGLQGAAIAMLALLLVWPRFEAPDYRGLSAAAPADAANALLMFSPHASEAQIRQALRASGATLVGGPTATDAYLLHLPGDGTRQLQALQHLRGQPFVTLAESLQAEEAR